jgi:hypothetical protein
MRLLKVSFGPDGLVFHFSDGSRLAFSNYAAALDASRNSDRALHDSDSLTRWQLIDEYLKDRHD